MTEPALFAFDGIGTRWEVLTEDPLPEALQRTLLDRVDRFDRTWSRFRDDSLIAQLAQHGGRVAFPAEAGELFDVYDRLHDATDGAVDPLVGRDLELLGYDADYRLLLAPASDFAAHRAGGRRRWDRHVRRSGTTLIVDEPALVDVGAAAKGLLVDELGRLIAAAGIETSLVDGSGDMRRRGRGSVRVGLEHPRSPSHVVGVLELSGGAALCASSTVRRAWGPGLHHVLDGRTGLPVTGVIATWVVAGDALTADGIATALFSTPAERLGEAFDFASVRMLVDGRLQTWGDLPGEIFR